jgi:hypothetical protein
MGGAVRAAAGGAFKAGACKYIAGIISIAVHDDIAGLD